MAILSAKKLPDDFKAKCCDCGEEITKGTIQSGSYAHIVKNDATGVVLRCECCQDDHDERNCDCDD
jgi:hypothetical protein